MKKGNQLVFGEYYHTLNSSIPKESHGKPLENKIGMDTGNNRDWLTLWIGRRVEIEDRVRRKGKKKEPKSTVFASIGVTLSRDDAWNLIEEIKERLF